MNPEGRRRDGCGSSALVHPSSFLLHPSDEALLLMHGSSPGRMRQIVAAPRPTMSATHDPPGRRLRDAWQRETIAIPGVFCPLVAKLAARMNFQAVYLSGAALSASLGLPDVGLVTATEFADSARAIAAATAL